MSEEFVKLPPTHLDLVQRLVGHWTDRYQTSPEEFARTFYDPETGRGMDPGRLRDVMAGEGDVLSTEDIRIFTEVVCEELKEIEKEEVAQARAWLKTPPRTVADVVNELNEQYAKG